MANYAKMNKVSLIGIINYEVAKYQGNKEFFIQYADHSSSNPLSNTARWVFTFGKQNIYSDHQKHIENTLKYLQSKGVSYKVEKVYKDAKAGSRKYKKYSGVKITVSE